eukprot:2767195-Alexandrium_andersonii.AAC.1
MAGGPAASGALPCAPEPLAGGVPFAEAAAGGLSVMAPLLLAAAEVAAAAEEPPALEASPSADF